MTEVLTLVVNSYTAMPNVEKSKDTISAILQEEDQRLVILQTENNIKFHVKL